MADEWPYVSVAEIAASAPNALATGPFGSAISSKHFQSSGVPVIRGSNLTDTVELRLNEENLVFLSHEKAREFSRSLARRGDLVFTCWGTVGQVGLIDERARHTEFVVSNKQMKLTPDPLKADSLYLYYCFSSPAISSAIKNQAIGTSVPGFNLGQLRTIQLPLPPLQQQRRIAHVLGTIDDKIAMNRRMNATLEAMARALFKSWFVDFEPVRAKAEGRAPSGMDAATAQIFPSEFEESEVGMVPRGWPVTQLGELLELAYGKALKDADRRPGPVPVYGSNGVVGMHDTAFSAGPSIVVGRKGNAGAVTWAPGAFFPIDTTFFVLPKRRCPSLHFLYFALKRQDLASQGTDSAVPGLNRNIAYMSKQLAPTTEVLDRFDEFVVPIFSAIACHDEQSAELAKTRDLLLPRLLAGKAVTGSAGKVTTL